MAPLQCVLVRFQFELVPRLKRLLAYNGGRAEVAPLIRADYCSSTQPNLVRNDSTK